MIRTRPADDVTSAGSRNVRWVQFSDGSFESGSVIYFQDGNHNISRRLALGMKSLDGRTADGNAGDERGSELVIRNDGVGGSNPSCGTTTFK